MMKLPIGHTHPHLTDVACFLLTLLCDLPGRSLAVVHHSESDQVQPNSQPQQVHSFPWADLDIDIDASEIGSPLSRDRREANETTGSKSVWEKIEEFYSDKNNMAMFCVLPILILIYGGCSSIYCFHKCRQYIRGRKHKRLKGQDCDSVDTRKSETHTDITDNLSVHEGRNRPVSQISSAWTDLQIDTSDSGWSAHTKEQTLGRSSYSPLSWLAAGRDDPVRVLVQNNHKENVSCPVELEDVLQTDDGNDTGKRGSKLSNELHQNSRNPADAVSLDIIKQSPIHYASRPKVPVRSTDPRPFEQTRTHVNLAEYTTKSTCLKAADYSRFSESRSIEIIPLSADPNLSDWHPIHNQTSREGKGKPYDRTGVPRLAGVTKHDIKGAPEISILDLKKDMLAKYDAMSTLNPYLTEKNSRKQVKKKHIFITE